MPLPMGTTGLWLSRPKADTADDRYGWKADADGSGTNNASLDIQSPASAVRALLLDGSSRRAFS